MHPRLLRSCHDSIPTGTEASWQGVAIRGHAFMNETTETIWILLENLTERLLESISVDNKCPNESLCDVMIQSEPGIVHAAECDTNHVLMFHSSRVGKLPYGVCRRNVGRITAFHINIERQQDVHMLVIVVRRVESNYRA